MSKSITTHEFARLLLQSEDKPLFISESYEVQGDYCNGYSNIKGILAGVVEEGFVIDVDYLAAKPNDKIYKKGDAIVTLLEPCGEMCKLNINKSNLTYMLFEKASFYHSWHVDRVGFFESKENEDIRQLKPLIEIAITSGFHPTWETMDLDEACIWYSKNFPEQIDSEFSSDNS